MRKYTEEFINSSEILKKAIIGFEFEFFLRELSFYKTLEHLNDFLKPVQVYGFRSYHPNMKPDANKFLLTPDLSGGSNMVEVITGPLPYFEAKFYLIKILKFIQDYGFTNDKASIHFNVSFSDLDLTDLNVLKLILNTDEDEIYRTFPTRKNNVYAKSIKKIIPYKEYDFNSVPIDIIKNNIRLPQDKYYGINFLHMNKEKNQQRLEFRYIGGAGYENNIGDLIYFMDKFILNIDKCINVGFTETEVLSLEKHLDKNISNFKAFNNYDNFLVSFPSISLQVDQNPNYEVVSSYYSTFFTELFRLIESTENINDCIINWLTATQRFEIVNANLKGVMTLKDIDFINCVCEGIFEDCNIVNSEVNNSQVIRCNINGTQIKNSKVLNCVVDNCDLEECFFMNGYFNGNMNGGVFRSGNLGAFANISSTTRVVTGDDNFFDTKFGDDYDKKSDKGINKLKK